ncbi:protein kinase, partial [Streptomyces sp. LMG1-1-1.1]|uniref:protein kinase n=1 Tax=Streptomyces sp. LMG1-1-1.1 TaxID=3135245 RepID=UPI00346581DD
MDDYAGRVLADRYRLPLPPADADADSYADAYALVETRAFDTYSGQEVLVRQVPLPEFVDAEVLDGDGGPADPYGGTGRATRRPAEPVVRRAIEAAQAAAQIPDHPLLDQVFDVFAEAGSLWIVSEVVAARPLAALLAERPLTPYRAAEIGADVLTALRALHAHGWVHRNITARTVLVCDDGRVVLTGLAVGAAEEALCGYAPVPSESGSFEGAPFEAEPTGTEPFASSPRAPEPYVVEWPEPEEGYGSQQFVPEVYEAEVYEAEVYEAEVYEEPDPDGEAGERLLAGEHDGTDLYGTDPHGGDPDPDRSGWVGDGDADGDSHDGDSHDRDSHDGDSPGDDHTGADPSAAAPSAPYGADPYGRAAAEPAAATQPAPTPPTADVRAARAGAGGPVGADLPVRLVQAAAAEGDG